MSKKQIVVGWVGNYRRIGKRFDVAFHVCDKYGYKLRVAGFHKTMLHTPFGKMPAFYRSIDVLLVTSIIEAHPLVVYEALACEVPVIMLRVGDCIAENLPGIHYYKALAPEIISQAIEIAYKNRKTLGQEGRREIVRRWQWKHWIPQYTKMFQVVTKKNKDMRVAIVIDKPGWAWDAMCQIIRRELLETGLYKTVDIYYHKGVDKKKGPYINNLQHGNYDVILNHYWHAYNHRNYRAFPHSKTIPCANGEAYKEKQWKKLFAEIVDSAPAIASVSSVIVRDLRHKFKRPIYHCSRGVDIDQFKP